MIIAIKTFQISYENPIFPDFSPRFSAILLSNISLTIDSILPKKNKEAVSKHNCETASLFFSKREDYCCLFFK